LTLSYPPPLHQLRPPPLSSVNLSLSFPSLLVQPSLLPLLPLFKEVSPWTEPYLVDLSTTRNELIFSRSSRSPETLSEDSSSEIKREKEGSVTFALKSTLWKRYFAEEKRRKKILFVYGSQEVDWVRWRKAARRRNP